MTVGMLATTVNAAGAVLMTLMMGTMIGGAMAATADAAGMMVPVTDALAVTAGEAAATTTTSSDVVPPLVPPGLHPPNVGGQRGGGTRWRGGASYRILTRVRNRKGANDLVQALSGGAPRATSQT